MNELLDDFAIVVDIKVEWGDMDALQHVNNIEYFKYFQIARIAYFENIDANGLLGDKRISSILAATQAKYIYPLNYPDTVSVGVRVDKMSDQYFTMKYAVVSHKHKRLATIGDAKVVMFDYVNNKKTSIPDAIRKTISDLEKVEVEIID
ncbi:MAG TPA: acyl-CoA thioesterase [Candidatus Thioglobus sp.]|jgi:acyl-CoA thioester hydrolase|nr:acyl-CoA thioesterase [Candidatus Thioglobus sp.]HIL20140.1 acyl-CoA thioesterase [Candidatus Thioglobus sp.]